MLPVAWVASQYCIHVHDRQEMCPTPKMTSTPLYSSTKNVNLPQLQPYHVKMFRTLLLQFFLYLPGPPCWRKGSLSWHIFFVICRSIFILCRKELYEGSLIPLCHKIFTSPIYKKFSPTFYKHLPLPPLTKLRGAI